MFYQKFRQVSTHTTIFTETDVGDRGGVFVEAEHPTGRSGYVHGKDKGAENGRTV